MNALVSEKGQVTIPKRLRDSLGLVPGAELEFEEREAHARRPAGPAGGPAEPPGGPPAEVRGFFPETATMAAAFDNAEITFDRFDRECADLAGRIWRGYRQRGGTRPHLVPDFLVGAHAQLRGGRLLTRDRGFYRRFFSKLRVVEA